MKFARLPLTTRLTVLFTLVAASVLLGLGALVAWATSRHFVELDRTYLDDKVQLVEMLVNETSDSAALTESLEDLLDSHHGLFIQVWVEGHIVYGQQDLAQGISATSLQPGEILDWTYSGKTLRGMIESVQLPATPSSAEASQQKTARVLVALDTAHHAHFLDSLRKTLLIYILVATFVSGLLGWWAANRGLSPLRSMRDRAKSVTAHNLQERMPVSSIPVEFAELAASLNGMFDRLQHDFQRLMDFSSDLAHELRTPLSNLLTQTQVALAQPRSADQYREILASNAEEFERLAKTVSDMLFLAKTENGIDLPHREPIRLHQEVLALFEFYEALADEKNISLTLHGEAEMDGDQLMIRRAISNLLSNALRHASADSSVEINISLNNGKTSLQITNQGQSIDPAEMPRLFDRFFRSDRSRSHPASEGAGLGLAITKAIINSHGGTIEVHSDAGRTCFTIVFG